MKNIKLICLMLALASALYGCGDAHIVGTSVDDNKIHISMLSLIHIFNEYAV